jgi:23S rRNA (adenine2503-C2)-methyltransferase
MFFAKKIARLNGLPAISHVVFMGMGEPADNSKNVVKAVEILTKNELFQLSASKFTVSTVLAPTPDAFKEFAKAPCVFSCVIIPLLSAIPLTLIVGLVRYIIQPTTTIFNM